MALRIVVLLKAVPVVGMERLDASKRVDRSSNLEPNGNDEYCLEKSLVLTEAHGGDVTVVSMGPSGAVDAIRKALAMGAARAVHVMDPAIAGSDLQATARILAEAVKRTEHDLVLAGFDSSDGSAGVILHTRIQPTQHRLRIPGGRIVAGLPIHTGSPRLSWGCQPDPNPSHGGQGP